MEWKEKLIHYQEVEGIANQELLDEAIASCESLFESMDPEKLDGHSRVLAISYLALLEAKGK